MCGSLVSLDCFIYLFICTKAVCWLTHKGHLCDSDEARPLLFIIFNYSSQSFQSASSVAQKKEEVQGEEKEEEEEEAERKLEFN